jgi:hypothetical protein
MRGCFKSFRRRREGQCFVVAFAVLQAVIDLADPAVEQVTQGGGMRIAVFVASSPVVDLGTRRGGQGSEGP